MAITMTTDEARVNWRKTIETAYVDRNEVVLERYNKPVVVMMNYDMWRMLTQSRRMLLERLSKEVDEGKYFTQEEVEAGLRERGLL